MAIEIKAPSFPESVAEGTVATWHKKPGEPVSRDELIVDIETDKVVLEVVAPADGTISKIIKDEGDIVESNEVIAEFSEGSGAAAAPAETSAPAAEPEPVAPASVSETVKAKAETNDVATLTISPAARKLIEEQGLDAAAITPTGRNGLITKEDVINHQKGGASAPVQAESQSTPSTSSTPAPTKTAPVSVAKVDIPSAGDRIEKRVPMTRLRATIARRLVEAQQTAAMLTTYNEVNMQPVMDLRNKYKDVFLKSHDIKLGFMSFFVKAAVESLKRFPAVNASIDGNDMVYHGYQDVGVAVSSDRGLVVPVLRNAEKMSMADIESSIADYGRKARDGKLGIEEMTGGTFTISNGGIFGSLMSTPILNPPQTAILGMHKIQERPMAVSGEVKILPMMYLALSYDHRMIDGKEAVQFLVAIKDMLEDPARILLEL